MFIRKYRSTVAGTGEEVFGFQVYYAGKWTDHLNEHGRVQMFTSDAARETAIEKATKDAKAYETALAARYLAREDQVRGRGNGV